LAAQLLGGGEAAPPGPGRRPGPSRWRWAGPPAGW
jgi:hypothetical protein